MQCFVVGYVGITCSELIYILAYYKNLATCKTHSLIFTYLKHVDVSIFSAPFPKLVQTKAKHLICKFR